MCSLWSLCRHGSPLVPWAGARVHRPEGKNIGDHSLMVWLKKSVRANPLARTATAAATTTLGTWQARRLSRTPSAMSQELEPPYVPKVTSKTDTSNFYAKLDSSPIAAIRATGGVWTKMPKSVFWRRPSSHVEWILRTCAQTRIQSERCIHT